MSDGLLADVLLGKDVRLGRYLWKQMPQQEREEITNQILQGSEETVLPLALKPSKKRINDTYKKKKTNLPKIWIRLLKKIRTLY